MENLVQSKAHREAWNKGKLVGQKAPLRLRDIWANAAVALLANSVATGAGLYVLISILGPISGAHFNPAVSAVFWSRGELSASKFGTYVAAQIVGAIVGVWIAHAMFDLPVLQASEKVRTGAGQWISELVATGGLLATILLGLRANAKAVPALVACYITAAYWFTASTSFANPAVTIARSLTNTFAGIRAADAPGFIAAQLAAALLVAIVVRSVQRKAVTTLSNDATPTTAGRAP